MRPAYISVIGAGNPGAADEVAAEEVGRSIAQAGAVLVCGGLGGVMAAAARGAKEAGGVTLGILPGEERSAANPYVDYVVCTGVGHARNLAVVSSGDATIAVGGGFGTLSEIGLAAKLGRPVIILGGWRLEGGEGHESIVYASSSAEAVRLALASLGSAQSHGDRGD